MTIGIYAIIHKATGKRYIGKSINIESRFATHRYRLKMPDRDKKQTNRHLWNAVQKHGLEAFQFTVVEEFSDIDEAHIAERELFWMDYYKTCDRKHGYNLRRDSSSKMEVHVETRMMQSVYSLGPANPNFGNNWSDKQKQSMSEIAKRRHAQLDIYNDDWRAKLSIASKKAWKCPEKRKAMGEKVSEKKKRYYYEQSTMGGEFIRRWDSIKEIVAANPDFKWQNIYSVCHGHKPSYRGFKWKQVAREFTDDVL